jgi:hypothetical protein
MVGVEATVHQLLANRVSCEHHPISFHHFYHLTLSEYQGSGTQMREVQSFQPFNGEDLPHVSSPSPHELLCYQSCAWVGGTSPCVKLCAQSR